MSFFKVITDPAPNNPTVGDTEFKQFYSAINRNMDWCTLEPFITQAEEIYIIPFISQEFYDTLHTEYQATDTIADIKQAKAFSLIRMALAYYTIYQGMPHLNTRIADAGIMENVNEGTQPARQWVFYHNRWEACKTAYAFLDIALAYMEKEIAGGATEFDDFKNSDAYTITKDLLIPNATTFNQFYNIQESRKSYVAFRPYIRKAEQLHLKPVLCDLFDEIKTQYLAGTLTAENTALLPYIQRILAEYTMIEAIPDINIIHDSDGFKVIENPHSSVISQQALANMIQQLNTKAETNSAQFKIELENFIYANLDDYPTYKDSDCNQIAEDDDVTSCEDEITPGAVII